MMENQSKYLGQIQQYFTAFGKRDLKAISEMLTESVELQDPIVGVINGKDSVLKVYDGIFSEHSKIDWQLKRIYDRGEGSVAAEFELSLVNKEGNRVKVSGVDCIEFCEGKITGLRAYLDLAQ